MAVTSNFSQTQWAVEGPYGPGYISPSALLSEREIRNKIFDRYDEKTLFDFLVQSERKEVSAQSEFNWFEHNEIWQVATVESASGTTGAGNAVTITLTAGDHLESGSASLFMEDDIVGVYTSSGVIKGQVTATNKTTDDAHTVTVQPVSTVDLVSEVAADDKVFLITSAAGDGSSQPGSVRRQPQSYTGYTQIIKDRFLVDGSTSANKSEVMVDGKPYYYIQGVIDADLRNRMKINYAMVIGHGGTDGTEFSDPENSAKVYTSDSLESVMDARGNTLTYTTFAIGDLQDMVKKLSRERASKEHIMLTGIDLNSEIDEFAKGYLDNTQIDYSAFGSGNAKQRAIDLGFDHIRLTGFTFHKQAADFLNYTGNTAFTGSPYPEMGFSIPLQKVENKGKEIDSITAMIKANDRNSRYMRHHVKDLFEVDSDGKDQYAFDHLTEVGLRFACANTGFKITK